MFRLAKLRQDWQLPTGYWWTYLSNRRFSAVGVFLQQTCGWKIKVYKNHRGNRNWLVIVLHYPAQNLFVDLVPNQQFFFNNPFETQMPEIENLWKILEARFIYVRSLMIEVYYWIPWLPVAQTSAIGTTVEPWPWKNSPEPMDTHAQLTQQVLLPAFLTHPKKIQDSIPCNKQLNFCWVISKYAISIHIHPYILHGKSVTTKVKATRDPWPVLGQLLLPLIDLTKSKWW